MTSIEFPTDLHAPGAVDALIAAHRAVFGDAVMMADTNEDASGDDGNGDVQDATGDGTDTAGDDEELRDSGKRALQAERRRAREAEKAHREALERAQAAEKALTEREEAEKRARMTEEEKREADMKALRDQIDAANAAKAEAEREREAATLTALRFQIAAEKGIANHAHRLVGATREEIEADAEAFRNDLQQRMPQGERYVDHLAGMGGGTQAGAPVSMADAMAAYRASRQHATAQTNTI